MRKLFQIALLAAVFMIVSCGGGKGSDHSCQDGYEWSGTDCVKISGGDTGIVDTGSEEEPDGGDSADSSSDGETDDSDNDGNSSDYHGSCTEIRNGEPFEINVVTKKLTVGTFKINGEAVAEADLYGELWAENKETLSEFKVGDIKEISGKEFKFPKGRYNFAFRPTSLANKVVMQENIDLTSGDRKLDFDLPLVHLKGKVLKNGEAAFTVEDAYQAETKLILKTGAFEKEIPYSEFAAYDILLPKGSYTVSFKGQLAAGQGIFTGTVLPESKAISLEEDMEKDIDVKVITFAGSIVKDGYAVSSGSLILVENPPLGAINGTVAASVSATSYSIAVTEGASLNLLYLPDADSYPVRYIKLETWSSETPSPSSHNINLDFARVHGKITFLGGNTFPSVAKCMEEEECPEGEECPVVAKDCTIGKLKAVSDDQSYILKDLGTTVEGEVTYDALLVRRVSYVGSDSQVYYNAKKYNMVFESHLNDIKEQAVTLPFSVPAEYENSAGAKVSSFSFKVVNEDETETWLSDKELNLDVVPSKVSGKLTMNGSTFVLEGSDKLKLRDESGAEYQVFALEDISEGRYSFYVPDGSYSLIYEGKGILGKDYKTYIDMGFEVNGDDDDREIAMKTGKVTLDFNVNGTPFAQWVEAQESLKAVALAVNIDKTASDFVFDLSQKDGKYVAELITGSTVNIYLELEFADKVEKKKSFSRIPLLKSHKLTSGTTAKNDLTLVAADMSLKLNGEAVKASEYAAMFKLRGNYTAEIYCPANGSVGIIFPKGEYKNPVPELVLHEGFGTKQDIALPCVYFGE